MDVIQLAQAGFLESVAALGTALTSHHVATLLRLTDHVVFAFDGDAAGRKAARRALEASLPVIGERQRASFLLLPEGEDPDSLIKRAGAEAFRDELAQALPLSRFFLRTLAQGRALDVPEDRSSLLADARPLLQSMPANALRLQLTQELAAAARTSLDDVEALFGLRRQRPSRAPVARPSRHAEVEDLKRRIVQHLLAHPVLAREFSDSIIDEIVGREADDADHQIVEIWRSATAEEGGLAASPVALMEALGGSVWAAEYRQHAAREMSLATSVDTARRELGAAFLSLELARVSGELESLIAHGLNEQSRGEIQRLMERQARLKAARRDAAGSL